MDSLPVDQHNIEIQQNLNYWKHKPVLQLIYRNFYRLISSQVDYAVDGKIVELGSGIGNVKLEIPRAICTDLFLNPWIDQVENAYSLSFADEEVSNLILFDVFHHLQFPGTALSEFMRVLKPGGRVIIFDPSMSALGFLIYGIFHHEPVGWFRKIHWEAPSDFEPWSTAYYAAQGNAEKVFFSKNYQDYMADWKVIYKIKLPALSYVLSGGYSKPQLFPWLKSDTIEKIEKVIKHLPILFSTRALVVLQKK